MLHTSILKACCLLILAAFLSLGSTAQRKVEYFHPNGTLKEQGILLKGKKDGEWKEWDDQGRLRLHETYDQGSLRYKKSFSNGQLRLEVDVYHTPKQAWTKTYDGRGVCWHEHYENNRRRMSGDYDHGQIGCRFTRHTPEGGIHYFTHSNDVGIAILELPRYRWHKDGKLSLVSFANQKVAWHENEILAEVAGFFGQGEEISRYRWNKDGKRIDNHTRVIENDSVSFDKSLGANLCKTNYNEEGLPHGEWENYYPNGQLWYKQSFENGRSVGGFESYFFDGSQHVKAALVKGIFHGKYEEWYPDGTLKAKGELDMGEKDGQWETYNETGQMAARASFTNLHLDGLQEEYYADIGQLKMSISYANGKLDGKRLEYNREGVLLTEVELSNGIEVTPWIKRHRNGNLESIKMREYGIMRTYDTAGELSGISYYSHQNPGTLSIVYREGKVSSCGYRNGEYTAEVRWREGIPTVKYLQGEDELDPAMMPWSWLLNPSLQVNIVEQKTGSNAFTRQYYYPTGKLWLEENYKNGRLHGTSKVWLENGKQIELSHWQNGLREGASLYTDQWDRTVKEAFYVKGLLHGEQRIWYPQTEQLKSISRHTNGALDGYQVTYSNDGKITAEKNFSNGLEDGLQVRYKYPEYHKLTEHVSKKGVKQGPYKLYHADGYLAGKGQFEEGFLHGKYLRYDAEGKVVETKKYDYGEQIVEAIDFACQCEANYELTSKGRYMPRIVDIVKYENFAKATAGQMEISEEDFNRLFVRNLYFDGGSYQGQSASFKVVALDSLEVWFSDMPHVRFNLNPCLKGNRYSEMHISATTYQPFPDLVDEDEGFDEKASSYFELAYAIHMQRNYSATNFIEGLGIFLSLPPDPYTIYEGRDSLVNWVLAEGVSLEVDDYISERDSDMDEEEDMDFSFEYWGELSYHSDLIAEKIQSIYFSDEVVEKGTPSYTETQELLWAIFPNFKRFTLEELKAATRLQANVQTDLTQMAIDFDFAFLKPVLGKAGKPALVNGKAVRSRLLFEVDQLRYRTEYGVQIDGTKNLCFTESEIGSTKATLNFTNAELVTGSNRFEELVYTLKIKEEWKGAKQLIYSPNATGQLRIKRKKYNLSYKDLFMDGKYFTASLIDLPQKKKDLKKMKAALTESFYNVEEKEVDGELVWQLWFVGE